jgi:tetratricopeptide (TPR) repeat protein
MIVLHRIGKGEGLSVSATTLIAPREARKAWEKGVHLLRSAQPPDPGAAEKEFERAVRIYPRYAEAWLDLGRALQSQQKEDSARDAFLKAVDADGKRVEPVIELGLIASRRQQWPEAARFLDRALQLDPVDYPHLWYDDAEADYHVRSFDRAEKNAREALKMAPPNREWRAQRLLGLVLLSKKDYAGAEQALRAYLRESPDVEDWDELHAKLEEIRGYLQAQP